MKYLKRIAVIVLGGLVLAIGIALIVLPGPAFIVIPAGLAILALEFAWARRWLDSVRSLLPERFQGAASSSGKLFLQSILEKGHSLSHRLLRTFLPKRRAK